MERDKIVNPIFTSDFRGANQVHFAARAAVVYDFSSLPFLRLVVYDIDNGRNLSEARKDYD